ncbi:MAG: prephenate dehydrogenase/arogenate dehydrogenase family protein [Azospirillum brasilense]|nr:MAG: prephenate dehydrogenase/arogenate dehydrogenase family protein [Azospirillum brasilense]
MTTFPAPADEPSRPGLGLIGAGAFGGFCLPHLRPFFRIHLADPRPDLGEIAARHGVRAASLAEAAAQPFVLLAVPVAQIAATGAAIAPHLRPGTLVVDTCSLKLEPLRLLRAVLPASVELVGTHPLFGPNSGRHGIAGLRVTVCPGRGGRHRLVERFLERALGLTVIRSTAEAHDREMAQVQGLTHLVARLVDSLDLPRPSQTTPSFEQLMRAVEAVRDDSEALFRTITQENPFVTPLTERFFATAREMQARMSPGSSAGCLPGTAGEAVGDAA